MKQSRIAILSNAGGSGKTTLSVHLSYLLARKGLKTVAIDLDPQGSVSLFTGLEHPSPSRTISRVLSDDFDGDWPLVPLWPEWVKNCWGIQGDMELVKTIDRLVLNPRGAYLLADRLEDHPLPADVLIFDCPATLGPLSSIALSAATAILIPVQLEAKSLDGAAKLLKWLYDTIRYLRLAPPPEILGFIPNQYDRGAALHRGNLEQLQPVAVAMKLKCYPPVGYYLEFKNASAAGLPLCVHRPGHRGNKEFDPIVNDILDALKNS